MTENPEQPENILRRVPLDGFLKVEPTPSKEILSKFYGDKYFFEGNDYRPDYTNTEKKSFLHHVNLRLDEAADLKGKDSVIRTLDLGCGEGWASVAMLEFFQSEVVAVDMNRHGLKRHNPQLLDLFVETTVEEYLESVPDQSFDLMWADHLLEHHTEPEYLMVLMRRKLKEDGVAILTVPNDDSDYQSMLRREERVLTNWWVSPPEHLNYFNKNTFTSFAMTSGFRCLSVLADFPIDWFLANRRANYVNDKDLGHDAFEAKQLIESEIARHPSEQQRTFYKGLAEVGLGRNLTYFLGI